MSTYFAGPFQRKAMERHDGEVAIASIWLAFYLCMVVGALFVNRNGSVMLPLALFAAVVGGWSVLGWRRKKRASHIIQMDDAAAVRTHHFGQRGARDERIVS